MINQIHNMDCLEGMKLLQDKSVDMILCDLPYGVTQNKWDVVIPFNELWQQYERIIKDSGAIVLTAAQPFSAQLIVSNPKLFRYEWIWEKTAATGHLNAKKMPMRAHESILVFYKKLPTYNPIKTTGHAPVNSYTKHQDDGSNYGKTKVGISGGGSTERYPRSVQRFSTDKQKEAIHPTQKPVALFEYLIKTYTNEGETVLDNCIGSGTTAVAALNTNRNFIGFEISKEYCVAANERINNLQQVLQVI
ncbi:MULTISPECIES: DNA-methyltransferase [Bacillus cereus group]|uniref:DNA-methyltransferase n=1 Tax=Bacillus cereus group TaxID=86661 RepID=UPI002103E3EA|nr:MULTISPECIES: site-specific DNA-methyltransferase [Bacillus cereus group]MED0826398.1 site-specific DNA-methyltransferase [Bacillus pacificus]